MYVTLTLELNLNLLLIDLVVESFRIKKLFKANKHAIRQNVISEDFFVKYEL